MTWLTGKKRVQYHWVLDLFHRLRLPLFDGMEEAIKKAKKSWKKLKLMNLKNNGLSGKANKLVT